MEEINKDLIIDELPTNKKTVLYKTILIAVAVIGIMLIPFNFIPVNLKVSLPTQNAQSVAFYQGGGISSQIWQDSDADRYNKVVNKLNKTLANDNLAYALFSGKLFYKEQIQEEQNYNIISNMAMTANENVKYVCFNFGQEQQIMVNGKEYSSNNPSSTTKYVKLLIEIKNTKNLTTTKIYYVNSNGTSNFCKLIETSGAEMFNYISNFF